MMVPIYLKFSLMMDNFGHLRWTFISFCFYSVMQYSAFVDALKWFGVANIDFYDIKVIKDEREQKI